MKLKTLRLLAALLCILLFVAFASSCSESTLTNTEERSMTEAVDKLNAESKTKSYVLVSFPGLGVEPLIINKTVFAIGNFTVYWYGVIITLAIVIAFIYAFFMSKRDNIKTDDLLDVSIWGIIAAVISSRLFYVLTSFDKFKGKSFWKIFEIWDGGVAIFGALIGGAIAIAIVCKIKKINVKKVFDIAAPAMLLGQAIGRWGNFINGESYGYELREGALFYWLRMGVYPHLGTESGIETLKSSIAYVHPTFLYESLWNFIGFAVIFALSRKKKFDGQSVCLYLAWYGFGRTFIELLRTDSLYVFETIKISALIACLCFFVGVALLIYGAVQGKKIRLASEEYESAYPLFHTKSTSEQPDKDDENPLENTDCDKGEKENEVD